GRGAGREDGLALVLAFRSRAGYRDVRRLERLRVPRHRAALARNVEAHRELAPGELRSSGIAYEGQRHRVTPCRVAGSDRGGSLAAEGHGAIGAGDEGRAREMQADEDRVERHRLGTERVGEAEAGLAPPDL